MFVYNFHCAPELTEGFTDINVLIISLKKALHKASNENSKIHPPVKTSI